MRLSFRSITALVLVTGLALPAHAASKEMIQLQTQIQQLQDAVARLQQSNDERMGVLKDLVQQTADSVNKMSVTVNGLQLRMQNTQDAIGTKQDQLTGQVQSLNDSLDELKARMARMEKMLADVQSQQQSANAILGNLPQSSGAPASLPSNAVPSTGPASGTGAQSSPAAPLRMGPTGRPAGPAGPPVADLYHSAYSDYMSAKYALANSEFDDLIAAYPDDNLAGNAFFYQGEIAMRTTRPSAAIKAYDHLIERYPDNPKIPAAHLHKAEALTSMKQTDASIRELRTLIERFPTSPEAAQARTKLAAQGVPAAATTTAARPHR